MPKAMTAQQCAARAEALEEAADHLDLEWTDDPVERTEGNLVSQKLRSDAQRYRDMAQRKRAEPPRR